MILKAKPGIYAPALSAGLPTVSFRMPNHELTLSLIEQVGIPLVGPSANQSTKPSPTRVEHCGGRYGRKNCGYRRWWRYKCRC